MDIKDLRSPETAPRDGTHNNGDTFMIDAWTDYPITGLGDIAGEIAPIRRVKILSYDQNKYCMALIEENGKRVIQEIKSGYFYNRPARAGNVNYKNLYNLGEKIDSLPYWDDVEDNYKDIN